MATQQIITRQELYDKVWSIPISRLAMEFGRSHVDLAKICKRYKIPRPGVGYWARIAHGKNVVKEPLPDSSPGEPNKIEFTSEADESHFANRYDDTRFEHGRIEAKATSFGTAQSNRLRHPLVLALQKIRRELRPDTEGWLSPNYRSFLDVRATQDTWDRPLRIMNMVLYDAESLG